MFPRLAVLLFATFGVVGVVNAAPALAQDTDEVVLDLLGDTTTVVAVDPATSSIEVTHRYAFENTTVDQAFSGFFETLPLDARDVGAVSGGSDLPAVNIPDGEGFAEWLVSFDTPLNPGQRLDVELTWHRLDLSGDPNAFGRVSRDLIAIDLFPVGHRGTTTMEVVVPGEWEVVLAENYSVEFVDDTTTLRIDMAEALEYVATPIVLEAPERFERTTVDAGPVTLTVATADGASSWFGDELTPLVEGLAEWIPLSPPTELEFRQGFTGGDDLRRDGDTLVLPLDASPVVAARAVATAWLAPMSFTDPALRDDLAAALADRVGGANGLVASPSPGPWSTAVAALVAVSDQETMTTILTALDGGVPAYGGADDAFASSSTDWRRFTDVADHLGGIESAGDAMRLSADADQRAELDLRDAALIDYRALEGRAAPWLLPPLLRDAMAAWSFDVVRAEQGSVSELVSARDEMIVAADDVELDIGDHVRDRFEAAVDSMDPAWTTLTEQRAALEHVAEALRLDTGDRGVLSSLGMAGRDADAQLATMRASWDGGAFTVAADQADHLVEDYESSVGRGTLRLLIPLGVIVVVLWLWRLIRRRRRIQPAA